MGCFCWESTAIQKSAYTNSKNPFVVAIMISETKLSILVTFYDNFPQPVDVSKIKWVDSLLSD